MIPRVNLLVKVQLCNCEEIYGAFSVRDFSDRSRFTIRSLPEIFADVSVTVAKLKARRDGIGGRMSREAVLNSLFCYFSALPLDEQLRIYDAGAALLQPLLDLESSEASPAVPNPTVEVVVEDVTDSKPKSSVKRKRSG